MSEDKRIKIEFVDACLMFKEKYPSKAARVSFYMLLQNSEAIEIHYNDGRMSVWDPSLDFEVTVRDSNT